MVAKAHQASTIHSHIAGRAIKPLQLTVADVTDAAVDSLAMIGINISHADVADMMHKMGLTRGMSMGMDAAPDLAPLVGTAALGAPLQFLQAWLPGLVHILTAARKADELMGVTTIGSWEDEEIVQGVLEPTGLAQAYADRAVIPLASWNLTYERRSIVRFEQGMSVGRLEDARTAKQRVNTAAQKRASAALALDILRNRISFYGWNTGLGRTYGFLNDPGLPAYVNVANGGGGSPLWSTKTFLEIIADIREASSALQLATQDTVDPFVTPVTLALGTVSKAYLSVCSIQGISVADWIKTTFANMRVISAPELVGANGGANVFYLYADKVTDGVSDDGGDVWLNACPSKFMMLGTEQRAKQYVEDYSNATAGVMLKRPYAVIRRSGI